MVIRLNLSAYPCIITVHTYIHWVQILQSIPFVLIVKVSISTPSIYVGQHNSGTDLGGFQGAKGTPWALQGVPGNPCGFGWEEFLKCFYCQMRLPQLFLHFNK